MVRSWHSFMRASHLTLYHFLTAKVRGAWNFFLHKLHGWAFFPPVRRVTPPVAHALFFSSALRASISTDKGVRPNISLRHLNLRRRHSYRHKPHTAAAAAYATQTKPAYSNSRSPSARSRTLACSHAAIRSPSLPSNGLNPYTPCDYIYYYLRVFTDPGGIEDRVGLVKWLIAESLSTKRPTVNHRSGAGPMAKERQPLSHAANVI